jgi:hypothetical protein
LSNQNGPFSHQDIYTLQYILAVAHHRTATANSALGKASSRLEKVAPWPATPVPTPAPTKAPTSSPTKTGTCCSHVYYSSSDEAYFYYLKKNEMWVKSKALGRSPFILAGKGTPDNLLQIRHWLWLNNKREYHPIEIKITCAVQRSRQIISPRRSPTPARTIVTSRTAAPTQQQTPRSTPSPTPQPTHTWHCPLGKFSTVGPLHGHQSGEMDEAALSAVACANCPVGKYGKLHGSSWGPIADCLIQPTIDGLPLTASMTPPPVYTLSTSGDRTAVGMEVQKRKKRPQRSQVTGNVPNEETSHRERAKAGE